MSERNVITLIRNDSINFNHKLNELTRKVKNIESSAGITSIYINQEPIEKQGTIVNIPLKTINGESIVGNGNIEVEGSSFTYTQQGVKSDTLNIYYEDKALYFTTDEEQ